MVGEFNGDGKPDIAVDNVVSLGSPSSLGSVGVLFGNGDGTFQALPGYASGGSQADSVATGDFNGDGRLDLAIANLCLGPGADCSTGTIGLLSGNGDGSFHLLSIVESGPYTNAVAVGDFDNDGKADLAVANYCKGNGDCSTGSLTVRLGKGDGTFRPATVYGSGTRPYSVAAGDFNRDGKPDLVVANDCAPASCGYGGWLAIYLGHGDGTFDPVGGYNSGGYYAESVVVGDLNGDGKLDLAVANVASNVGYGGNGRVAVLLGNSDGTFQPAVPYDAGGMYAWKIAVGDVNADGKLDLAVATNYGLVRVFLGKGDDTFPVWSDYTIGSAAFSVALQDFNGNGKPDLLVTSDRGTSVLLGKGDGTFEAQTNYLVAGLEMAIGDFNGDAKPDVALNGGDVFILLNVSSGSVQTTTALTSSPNPSRYREDVTFTVTVSGTGANPAGMVTFRDGAKSLGTGTLNSGVATLVTSTLSAGRHSITAVYGGDANYSGSTSAVLKQVVLAPPSASTTVVETSGSPSMVKQLVTFTATVSSPDGPIPDGELVTFSDNGVVLTSISLAGGVASYSTSALKAKTHVIKATYAGDATFKPSTGRVTQVVVKYSTTTVLSSSPNPSAYGQRVTFTATVTPTGPYPLTGTVKFWDGTTAIGTAGLHNGVAKLSKSTLAVGTHPITAQYLGDAVSDKSTSSVVNQGVQ